jgi:hypothetical protein
METSADCNWIYNLNPLTEDEFNLEITRIADAKTTVELERHGYCKGLPRSKTTRFGLNRL